MTLKRILLALLLALAVPAAALAHSPQVPRDPEQLARYQAGLAAYYNRDYATALKEWRPIAEQGNSAAQLFLGFLHANGQGVARDEGAAADWYRRAAEQDNMLAQIRLAMIYGRGQGVRRDPVAAHLWASLAARDEKHLKNVALAFRKALEGDMTPEQVAEAERRMQAWLDARKKRH